MDAVTTISLLAVGAIVLGALAAFAAVSIREGERRAAGISAGLAAVGGGLLFGSVALPHGPRLLLVAVLGILALGGFVGWFLPVGTDVPGNGRPRRRVDERDIMFARARLAPGSPEYETYYATRPEHRESDDRTRALPGLLSSNAKKAETEAFTSARASFEITEALSDAVDGPIAGSVITRSPEEASRLVKSLALYTGAVEVGIARLEPRHVYSHVGRGPGIYGEEIAVDHAWAVAFTVEMDHAVMRSAPAAPVVAESARQYVEAAKIGVQLAAAIRGLGYPARAHIDGNYRVIAPLVAVDAGLGEIGRMGILMTPRLGPRVRLGVVTTNLPLIPDPPGDDLSVLDFCTVCRKCAESCPSKSIPFGEREAVDGGLRWALDADTCFRYWNLIGTDCGRCMAVCPYSHPDNTAHNLVRWTLERSGTARRAALGLDDLFYGRRPIPTPSRKVPPTGGAKQ